MTIEKFKKEIPERWAMESTGKTTPAHIKDEIEAFEKLKDRQVREEIREKDKMIVRLTEKLNELSDSVLNL